MSDDKFPPAQPHGELREVFPDVFFVTGTVGLPGPLPVRFSRNMTVIRVGDRLTLVNSVRLTDEGLRALDALGKVTDVVRLAGFHGLDDPFYKHRYGAKVWAVKGQRYTKGLDARVTETYFEADVAMDASTALPVSNAKLYLYGTTPPEAILVLDRDGGLAVAGDSLQHWHQTDTYFSFVGGVVMKLMGFIRPFNVGPGWFKQAKPTAEALRGVLALRFEHLLPAHGDLVRGKAWEQFRPAIERAAARA
jgi:hypothetical protein